jgi:EpsI family protein
MVAWGNGLVGTAKGWTHVVSRYGVEAPLGRVRGADLSTPQGRMRVWHWYRVNGRLATGDIEVKLRLAFDRVLGKSDESSVVVLFTPEFDAPELADERLRGFAELHAAKIEAALDAAAQERVQ